MPGPERGLSNANQAEREKSGSTPPGQGDDSVLERGMLVAPEIPVPADEVDLGNIPAAIQRTARDASTDHAAAPGGGAAGDTGE
jgi:hypothetical protein